MLKPWVAAACFAMGLPAMAAELPISACGAQVYSDEAIRYEMEGSARIGLTVDADGKATEPKLLASSGFAMLDRASLALISSCKFARPATPAEAASVINIPWILPAGTRPEVAPVFQPETCASALKLLAFVPADSPRRNMSIRTQVWSDGQPFTPKIEESSKEAQLDRLALEMIQRCRFIPATRAGQAVRSAALVTLAFDRAGISEEALRRKYDLLAGGIANETDFRVRHILVKTESEALAIMAALNKGEPFEEQAKKQSIDIGSAKKGGELGWLRPRDTVPQFSQAVIAYKQAGLLPAPVRSPFGWHIIEIEDSRASSVPAYDDEARRLLKQRLLAERRPVAGTTPP